MKFVALMSSGIDSPVATYLLSKKAEEIILIHADNRPFTDKREIEKFVTLAKYLKKQVPSKLNAYFFLMDTLFCPTKQHVTTNLPVSSANE